MVSVIWYEWFESGNQLVERGNQNSNYLKHLVKYIVILCTVYRVSISMQIKTVTLCKKEKKNYEKHLLEDLCIF